MSDAADQGHMNAQCELASHLHGNHGPGLADHAQLVLLRTLHFVFALLPHGPRQGYVLFQTVQLADAGLSTQVRSTLFEDLIFGQVSK